MIQHMRPARLHLTAMSLDICELRQLDAFKRAFLAEHLDKPLLLGAGFGVPVEIHNVVEITRPSALSQSPEFLCESFE